MNYILALVCLVITYSGCGSMSALPIATPGVSVADPAGDKKTPVLVELFTSEGCSSCPPADRLLIDIAGKQPYKDVDVIALGFHVDYWDHIGWRDRFSSRDFTNRQDEYSRQFRLDSIYTPQIVIDGETQVVGNDRKSVDEAVSKAHVAKADVKIEVRGDKLAITVEKLADQKGSTVFIAVAEDGLRSAVRAGENSGRTLEHAAVVRELRKVGSIDAGKQTFSGEFALPKNSEWKQDSVRYVVFVQDDSTKKIHGIGVTAR